MREGEGEYEKEGGEGRENSRGTVVCMYVHTLRVLCAYIYTVREIFKCFAILTCTLLLVLAKSCIMHLMASTMHRVAMTEHHNYH